MTYEITLARGICVVFVTLPMSPRGVASRPTGFGCKTTRLSQSRAKRAVRLPRVFSKEAKQAMFEEFGGFCLPMPDSSLQTRRSSGDP
jgi:hypothetical protein